MERERLIYHGTRSVEDSSILYLVVLGQKKAVLVDTLWYWVNIGRY